MQKNLFVFIFIYCFSFTVLYAQDASEDFYFDAIVFKSEKQDSARIDVFVAIPNERLNFTKLDGDIYRASFEFTVTISDNENNRNITRRFARTVVANSFLESQGSNAEFTQLQEQIYVPYGNFRVRAVLRDVVAGRDFERSRTLTVINFSLFPFAASSIMLVSSIEENNGRYKITPHISDNIGNLQEDYFAFLEVYNSLSDKKVNVITEITNSNSNQIVYSDTVIQNINSGTNQVHIRIPNGINYGSNTNILRMTFVSANEATSLTGESSNNILAIAQRTVRNISFLTNRIASDLGTAIRQMRYVATTREINFINEAPNEAEKLRRFEEFWAAHDPTPNTRRNEAMEEYFNRIDFANRNFRSNVEGWLTDRGQVFIVFGPPQNIERSNRSMSDNRTFEQWTYRNNRQFIFVDISGFGDFRLHSPRMVTERFQFERQ